MFQITMVFRQFDVKAINRGFGCVLVLRDHDLIGGVVERYCFTILFENEPEFVSSVIR